jgi:hypothetical protein
MLLQCHSFSFFFNLPLILSYLKQKVKFFNEVLNYDGLRYFIIKYLKLFNSLILMGSKLTFLKKTSLETRPFSS